MRIFASCLMPANTSTSVVSPCCKSLNLSIGDIATSITQLSEAASLTGEGVGMLAEKSDQLEQMMVRFKVYAPDRRIGELEGFSAYDDARINPQASATAAREFVDGIKS